jgi:NADPH-dependent 2,4-dienoyl-CoA reductase/sulfur reductase-like enzyme
MRRGCVRPRPSRSKRDVKPLDSVLVVGASLAGLSAAHALRRGGFEGKLTLAGAERHRPYQRPPLSKQLLAGDFSLERLDLRLDAALEAEWRLGSAARRLDLERREVEFDDGERVGFDALVIATGSRPRRLRAIEEGDGVFTLRTLDDCLAIRARVEAGARRAVIVGAGFIGCEVAATLRKRGLDVSLIDIDDVPMQRVLGRTLGAVALASHRTQGVRTEMSVAVAGVQDAGGVKRVTLVDGRTLEADLVIVGVGAEPVVDWLADSGIETNDGVLCDSACAVVGAERIVAAGDVARWHNPLFGTAMRVEHWDNAISQGEAAARTLLARPGSAAPYAAVPLFWSDQYDVKIQMLGAPRATDEMRIVEGGLGERRFVAAFLRDGRVVGAFAQNSMHRIAFYKKLIEERRGAAELTARPRAESRA